MTRTEALKELIRLGERSRHYWERELPKRHPKWPLVQSGESSGPPPPEDAEIRELLRSLREEDLYLLCLLMYVGRGDFDIDHLGPAYRKTRDEWLEDWDHPDDTFGHLSHLYGAAPAP